MKLKIEQWVEEVKPFSDSANDLFEEAVSNYKFGSYKSAFIMAYLSFKLTIRDRIIGCSYGSELKKKNPNFWENDILSKLMDDDKWEEQVNDIVVASCGPLNSRKDIGILNFRNSDLAKTEYKYWQEKRNACVHGKDQIIDSSTVKCFWNYLINNLSQFYVLGGEEYLLRELVDIYIYYKYPEIINRSRISGLLYDVNAVYQNHTKDYFERFFKEIKRCRNFVDAENREFWTLIIHQSQENTIDGFIECISTRGDIFFGLYQFFPELLERLVAYEPRFIIQTLSNWLKGFSGWDVDNNEIFWRILIDSLDQYGEQVDIDQIINENTLRLIKYFSGKDSDVAKLNRYSIFKKYILDVSDWYFKTDSDSQYRNFQMHYNDFSNVEICFSFLEWDTECLNRLEEAIVRLDRSLPERENFYSQRNGYEARNSFKKIIHNCQAKIEKVENADGSLYKSIYEVFREPK